MRKIERTMSNHLFKSILLIACLALLFMSVSAQSSKQDPSPDQSSRPDQGSSSCLNLSLGVSPSTVSPGGTVGEFALATNCSSSRIRTTVTFTSTSPCGQKTICGSHKLVLNPGQAIQVTCSQPIAPDACLGLYNVTISASSGQ